MRVKQASYKAKTNNGLVVFLCSAHSVVQTVLRNIEQIGISINMYSSAVFSKEYF